jgi:hypothetical protein
VNWRKIIREAVELVEFHDMWLADDWSCLDWGWLERACRRRMPFRFRGLMWPIQLLESSTDPRGGRRDHLDLQARTRPEFVDDRGLRRVIHRHD